MYKKFYALGGTDAPYRLTPKEGFHPVAIDTKHLNHIKSVRTNYGEGKEEYAPMLVKKSPIGISNITCDADMNTLIGYLNSKEPEFISLDR